jgi:hypothetical protein
MFRRLVRGLPRGDGESQHWKRTKTREYLHSGNWKINKNIKIMCHYISKIFIIFIKNKLNTFFVNFGDWQVKTSPPQRRRGRHDGWPRYARDDGLKAWGQS